MTKSNKSQFDGLDENFSDISSVCSFIHVFIRQIPE